MRHLIDTIGQFDTVPVTVVKLMPVIGVDAFSLWVYLRHKTNSLSGDAWPSYDTIQAETTITRHRISAALDLLETHHLLDRERRFGATTRYYIKCPPPEIQCASDTDLPAAETAPPPLEVASSADLALQSVQNGTTVVPNQPSIQIDSTQTESIQTETPVGVPAADLKPAPANGRAHDLLFDAIAFVCHVDPNTAAASVKKVEKVLLAAKPPYTPEEVALFGTDWWSWAERKDPPSLWALQEKIGKVRYPSQPVTPATGFKSATGTEVRWRKAPPGVVPDDFKGN